MCSKSEGAKDSIEKEIGEYVERYIISESEEERERIKNVIEAGIGQAKIERNPKKLYKWSEIEERIDRIEYEFF